MPGVFVAYCVLVGSTILLMGILTKMLLVVVIINALNVCCSSLFHSNVVQITGE